MVKCLLVMSIFGVHNKRAGQARLGLLGVAFTFWVARTGPAALAVRRRSRRSRRSRRCYIVTRGSETSLHKVAKKER